jgi:UDP-N-acetylglucosamine 4,6-dehydratase
MNSLSGSRILVTGGTGSFGRAFIERLIVEHAPERVVVFSRDELKQYEMKTQFENHPSLRFFIGDIRDRHRLTRAMRGIDFVVHAAALKQVDTAEYNPFEYVATNINGSQNVVEAALDNSVKKVIALSTDKASSPINLYGATKLVSDKLFQSANSYAGSQDTRFSVVRYGNVMGSRGSVVPYFRELAAAGQALPITDPRMTRFWITLEQAVDFVLSSLEIMRGGEVFVPKIPSMKILDLATAIAPNGELTSTDIRPGEKLHEEMISPDDSRRTIELSDRYIILPTITHWPMGEHLGTPVPEDFSYRSDTNSDWLTPDTLRDLAEI